MVNQKNKKEKNKELGHCDHGKQIQHSQKRQKNRWDGPQRPKSMATAAGLAVKVRDAGWLRCCRVCLRLSHSISIVACSVNVWTKHHPATLAQNGLPTAQPWMPWRTRPRDGDIWRTWLIGLGLSWWPPGFFFGAFGVCISRLVSLCCNLGVRT